SQIHVPAFYRYLEAAILRYAAFCNIKLRHNLDARYNLLGQVISLYGAGRIEHSVDSASNGEPAAGRLQMDIAGAGLESVVEGGVYKPYDGTGIFTDGLQRQIFHCLRSVHAGWHWRYHAIHGVHVFFDLRQIRCYVISVGQAESERFGYALRRPRLQIKREWVTDRHDEASCFVSKQGTFVRVGFGKRQYIKRRLQRVQPPVGERGHVQRVRKRCRELGWGQFQLLLEQLHDAALGGPCKLARLIDLLNGNEDMREGSFDCGIHWMLPANSKTGMYISMTMAPITRPMKAISNGSNSRVNQSTQRAISSSRNAAIRSIMSSMRPLRSPTRNIRSATGVVSPCSSIASEIIRPSRMASRARSALKRNVGESRPPAMSRAATAAVPPRHRMPSVR